MEMTKELFTSSLKLFKALPIETKIKDITDDHKIAGRLATQKSLLIKTIKLGFIFSQDISYNYLNCDDKLIQLIEQVYGLSAEKLNQSFHKSWKKVKDTPM